MTTEELHSKLADIPDKELLSICKTELSNMCRSGGKSFTMRVPVTEKDTDMLLSELFRRFDRYSTNKK